jgi:phosphonate degradation associated HDIG domain protein
MSALLQSLLNRFRDRGHAQYGGEAVSQLEHALQCATLAETAGHGAEFISACLLHDLGHIIHDLEDDIATQGVNDHHEFRAIPVLQKLFPPTVTEPIRLHVAAKRYLCAVEPAYWDNLSDASKRSLELQGGKFSPAAVAAFIQQPHAEAAVALRRLDERAKVPSLVTPNLDHFITYLEAAIAREARSR